MNKKDKKLLLISVAVVLGIALVIGIAYFVITRPDDTGSIVESPSLGTGQFSSDPAEAATRFIYLIGNIGNPDDINEDNILELMMARDSEGENPNTENRMNAYYPALIECIEGGPLRENDYTMKIKEYTSKLSQPSYYSISPDSITTRVDKNNKRDIQIIKNGEAQTYEAIDVFVDFVSVRTSFRTLANPNGPEFIGIGRFENSRTFSDVKVTLVNTGGKWFVYDISHLDTLRDRWAIWPALGTPDFNFEDDLLVETIMPTGFEAKEETPSDQDYKYADPDDPCAGLPPEDCGLGRGDVAYPDDDDISDMEELQADLETNEEQPSEDTDEQSEE